MSRIIYGATPYNTPGNELNIRYDAYGKNSEVFANNDVVGLASGQLLVNTTAAVGVVVKTATMTSSNVTVAKVSPGYIPVEGQLFLMGTNSDLTGNGTDAGTYYHITGTTGAQQVNVSAGVATGVTRSVEIVEVDPFNEGGTGSGSGLRACVVRILKTPYTNVTITT